MEYNRLLKQNAPLYIEVPAPDCERRHEWNLNHYSIFGEQQLAALLVRTGFTVELFNNIEFQLGLPQKDGQTKNVKEKFYAILARKKQPLDIK